MNFLFPYFQNVWYFPFVPGTGAGTGNLATVSDEDKNTDLKLLLGMAYAVKPKSGRYDIGA